MKDKKNVLFVLLHSYRNKPKSMNAVADLIRRHFEDPVIEMPKTTLRYTSTTNVNVMVNDLLKRMDALWAERTANGEPPKIILIGHSMGALLARKLYVCACGENADAPFEEEIENRQQRPWAAYVDRIVLLAGMNNGWSIDFHLSLGNGLMLTIGTMLGNLLSFAGFKPTAFSVRKGGSFITQLRIQSLSMQKHAAGKGVGDALTVQLLGSVDDIVSPEDNVDLISGSAFVYLEVPFSKHGNVIRMNDATRVGVTTLGALRSGVLMQALTETPDNLQSQQVITAESKRITPDGNVTDVVFVIHGIRDEGFWTHKVAQRVVKEGRDNGRQFETETSSYGYFPLLHFTLPNYRRAKVEWLMEQYTENLARYPNADFSFVGHSNGTYLMAKALKDYPACKFKNVLFAGSVVNRKYNWADFQQSSRIDNVFNVVATSDWVVGIFPKAFHVLGFRDLGSAGYDGFNTLAPANQVICIPGGHGAGVEEQYWSSIAEFIVHGRTSTLIPVDPNPRKFVFKSWISVSLLILIVLLTLGIACTIWYLLAGHGEIRMLLLILYLVLVWRILTRF